MSTKTILIIGGCLVAAAIGYFVWQRYNRKEDARKTLNSPPIGLQTPTYGSPSGSRAVAGNLTNKVASIETPISKGVKILRDVAGSADEIVATFSGLKKAWNS